MGFSAPSLFYQLLLYAKKDTNIIVLVLLSGLRLPSLWTSNNAHVQISGIDYMLTRYGTQALSLPADKDQSV